MTSKKLLALTLALAATAAAAQTAAPQLTPPAGRITDGAIHADLKSFEAQQARIKALNDSGRHPVASYPMAKAQCWLDVAFHEYSRNDRSAFPQEALSQSFVITEALEGRGSVDVAANTPRVNQGELLRPDLWDAAKKLKGHAGFSCVAQRVACAEVELAHAGNEINQKQWRHAKPYVQLAEDALADANRAADACIAPPAAPVAVAAPAPAPVPAAAPLQAQSLATNVLFNFDQRNMAGTRPYSVAQLDGLLAQIKSGALRAQAVQLVGHADVSNGTGKGDYNLQLSKDRVNAVRDYLVAQGVPAGIVTTRHESDSAPVVRCEGKAFRSVKDRQECLLPNRRVEVVVQGVKTR